MKEIILIIIIMNAVHVESLHAQSITNLEQKFKQFTIVSPSSGYQLSCQLQHRFNQLNYSYSYD